MKQMRKILSLSLALLLALTLIPATAYADECQHNWGPWVPGGRSPATCTEGGDVVRTCSICGMNEYDESGPLGHSWNSGEVTTAATCITAGVRTFTCTRCGERRTEQIPATGQHTWDGGTVSTAATCTAAGVRTFRCTSCGQTRTEQIAATGHHWDGGTVTTAATCTAAGVRTFRCSNCGQTRTEQIAAAGHSWDGGTVSTAATCTAAGVRTFRCANCGQTRTESIPALGHDWDTTGTTEPSGLTDGVHTRTCRRCGETETEIVPATISLFHSLRNLPPGVENSDDLVITQQPEGGVLDSGSSFYLELSAEGGTPPYTYEWHVITGGIATSILDTITDSRISAVAAALNDYRDGFASEFHNAVSTVLDPAAVSAATGIYSYGGTIQRQGLEAVELNLFDHVLEGDDLPSRTVYEPGRYYCVVRDEAGHRVTSQEAEVREPLYITEQPRNRNISGRDNVELTCRAAGGTPYDTETPYIFEWRRDNGTPDGEWLDWYDSPYGAAQEGDYFCLVSDLDGTVVRSETVTVYEADPLWITTDQLEYVIDPETGKAPVEMHIGGGVPAYFVEETRDGEVVDSYATESTDFNMNISDPGLYSFVITDAMGETVNAVISVDHPHLEITREPESGSLPSDGSGHALSVAIADGTPPFTYTLYRNGESYFTETRDEPETSVTATETGEYVFYIEDATGRWANSAAAAVTDSVFQVVRYTEDTVMPDSGGCHLEVEVEGGRAPYTYEWEWIGFEGGQRMISTGTRNSTLGTAWAEQPGYYFCYIWDADDTFQMVGAISVEAASTAPYITEDPQDVMYEPSRTGNVNYGLLLHCGARAYDGENDHLVYQWQWDNNGEWVDHPYTYGPYLAYSGYASAVCGRYRCVVTDSRSGESAVSGTAEVGIALTYLNGGIIPSSYHVAGERTYEYAFAFAGGRAPFTVELHELRFMGTNSVRSDLTRRTITVQNAEDMAPFVIRLQGQYEYYVFAPSADGEMEYLRQTTGNQYYIIVTDADGQTCTSEVIDSMTVYS